MKTALYRKYRPRSFGDVIGQEAVRSALKNQIASGRFGHSYIFTGIRGTGKTTLARILAKAVNCPNSKDGEPCGVCDICTGVDDGTMLDITEIDAASNSGVDSIRELREETAFAPNLCAFRVYIIDEVHMLSKEAWAALLKIMEEPPAHVIFILATTEIHKVPATILSRCQRYDLRRIPKEKIAARLLEIAKAEGIALTCGGAESIARLSDGAMRDALSLLDTSSSLGGDIDAEAVARLAGVADKSYLAALVEDIALGDVERLFGDLRSLYESSIDPVRLCYELLRRFRDLLALSLAGEAALESGPAEELAALKAEQAMFGAPKLLAILDELARTADKLAYAPDRTLALELALVRLCGGVGESTPPLNAHQAVDTNAKAAKPIAQPSGVVTAQTVRDVSAAANEDEVKTAAPADVDKSAPPESAGEGLSAPGDAPPWDEPQNGETAAFAGDPPALTEGGEGEENADEDAAEDDDLFQNVKRAAFGASGNSEPPAKKQPAETKPAAPPDAPEGVASFERWDEVLAALRSESPMIYGFLDRSRAYLDGAKLLISDNGKFFVIKDDRSKLTEIERAVRETTGLEVRVSAYEAPPSGAKSPASAELDDLFERAELNNITIDEITS